MQKQFNFEKAITPTLFDYSKLSNNKNYYITNFGDNFYEQVMELIQQSPLSKQIIENIIGRIVGKGIYNKATNKKDVALTNLFRKVAMDFIYFNNFICEAKWNVVHNKVLEINHIPLKSMRYSIDENILLLSKNWQERTKKIEAYQAFNPNSDSDSCQIFNHKEYTIEDRIYPLPYWFSCSSYITIDKLIGTGLLNNMNNNLTASFMVILNNGEPSDEEFDAIYKSIKKNYSGQENSGGFVLLTSSDAEHAPQIIPFPSNQNKENYEFINQISAEKIMNGFGVLSPILFGIERSGQSLGNGSEANIMNEIYMNSFIIPKREEILTALNELFKYSTINLEDYEVKNADFLSEVKNNEEIQ